MSEFEELLQSIAKRPAMYVGKCCLHSVRNYLDGYDHAYSGLGAGDSPLTGWGHYLESRFLISHPAWGWPRILLHVYGSHRDAIAALPGLYRDFLEMRAAVGVQGIIDAHGPRLIAAHGRDWYEPPTTTTSSMLEAE